MRLIFLKGLQKLASAFTLYPNQQLIPNSTVPPATTVYYFETVGRTFYPPARLLSCSGRKDPREEPPRVQPQLFVNTPRRRVLPRSRGLTESGRSSCDGDIEAYRARPVCCGIRGEPHFGNNRWKRFSIRKQVLHTIQVFSRELRRTLCVYSAVAASRYFFFHDEPYGL